MKYVMYLGLFLLAAAIAGGGYIVYDRLEQEKKEVEQAKQEKAAEDNSVLGRARQALADNAWTSGNLTVSYDDQTKTLFIADDSDPNSGLDQELAETTASPRDIVQQAYNLFVRAGEQVFTIEEIEKLEFSRKVPLNQGSGIVTPTQIVNISTNKEDFTSVDWEKLEGQPIHTTLATAAKVQMHTSFQRSIGNINALILVKN